MSDVVADCFVINSLFLCKLQVVTIIQTVQCTCIQISKGSLLWHACACYTTCRLTIAHMLLVTQLRKKSVSSKAVVLQLLAKIAICDCPMVSGDCIVALIAKLVKWEECS